MEDIAYVSIVASPEARARFNDLGKISLHPDDLIRTQSTAELASHLKTQERVMQYYQTKGVNEVPVNIQTPNKMSVLDKFALATGNGPVVHQQQPSPTEEYVLKTVQVDNNQQEEKIMLSYEQELMEQIKMKRQILAQAALHPRSPVIVQKEKKEESQQIQTQTQLQGCINDLISQLRDIQNQTRKNKHVSARRKRRMTLAELKELDDYEVEAHKIILQKRGGIEKQRINKEKEQIVELPEEISEHEYSYSSDTDSNPSALEVNTLTKQQLPKVDQDSHFFEIVNVTAADVKTQFINKPIKQQIEEIQSFTELVPTKTETVYIRHKTPKNNVHVVQSNKENDESYSESQDIRENDMDSQFDQIITQVPVINQINGRASALASSLIKQQLNNVKTLSPIAMSSQSQLIDMQQTQSIRNDVKRIKVDDKTQKDVRNIRNSAVQFLVPQNPSLQSSSLFDSTVALSKYVSQEEDVSVTPEKIAVRNLAEQRQQQLLEQQRKEKKEKNSIRDIRGDTRNLTTQIAQQVLASESFSSSQELQLQQYENNNEIAIVLSSPQQKEILQLSSANYSPEQKVMTLSDKMKEKEREIHKILQHIRVKRKNELDTTQQLQLNNEENQTLNIANAYKVIKNDTQSNQKQEQPQIIDDSELVIAPANIIQPKLKQQTQDDELRNMRINQKREIKQAPKPTTTQEQTQVILNTNQFDIKGYIRTKNSKIGQTAK